MKIDQEAENYINELKANLNAERGKVTQLSGATSMFNSDNQSNLIEWQLELDNILERIDHLLRGHVLKFDTEGNMTWQEPQDQEFALFNEYGVQEVLRILSMYLNRNTILSNYDEKTINAKVFDLGWDITDLIFMKYEQMGLNTPEKIKLYPIIVRELVDTVHSSYLRALKGGERESLRTARTVTQTDPIGNIPNANVNKKRFSPFKPTTWRNI